MILFFSDQLIHEHMSQGSRIIVFSLWQRPALGNVSFNLLSIFYIIKYVSIETDALFVRYIPIGIQDVSTPNFSRFHFFKWYKSAGLNSCKSLSEFKCSPSFENEFIFMFIEHFDEHVSL